MCICSDGGGVVVMEAEMQVTVLVEAVFAAVSVRVLAIAALVLPLLCW